ncbi:hypothetical protein KSF_050090 [Reticulibacter mediterranei]|uniref:Uncharacterized protein n=1 Tax=Reticulibacter mediterranei TaxID=2778369 RepID=A0A8J3II24_9CHLR|nr:hypothetical protein KSF_050090 [Reticulibacter mediterranei]
MESLHVKPREKDPDAARRNPLIGCPKSGLKVELAGDPRNRVVEATFMVAPQRLLPRGDNK